MLFKPILALHMIFSSCQNYWGGGQNYVCPPPPIFSLGATAPPGSTPLLIVYRIWKASWISTQSTLIKKGDTVREKDEAKQTIPSNHFLLF